MRLGGAHCSSCSVPTAFPVAPCSRRRNPQPLPLLQVVVGYPYTMAIDMWSLGCMAAELYLGLPLFPGACEHDLLTRMVSMLGPLPDTLLVHGKNTSKYFNCAEECVDVLEGGAGRGLVRQGGDWSGRAGQLGAEQRVAGEVERGGAGPLVCCVVL